MSFYSRLHWNTAKTIINNLEQTESVKVKYIIEPKQRLAQDSDGDWAGDKEERKSTSGYIFMFYRTLFSCKSRLQNIVSASNAGLNI